MRVRLVRRAAQLSLDRVAAGGHTREGVRSARAADGDMCASVELQVNMVAQKGDAARCEVDLHDTTLDDSAGRRHADVHPGRVRQYVRIERIAVERDFSEVV